MFSKPMQVYNIDKASSSVIHKPGRVFIEVGGGGERGGRYGPLPWVKRVPCEKKLLKECHI